MPQRSVPKVAKDDFLTYRADVDGLRAVAVLSVLIFHAFPAALPGGYVGVDIFFVISGYLITSQILAELDAGRFSFLKFYARRARRIFPALALVLAATMAFGAVVLLPDELMRLGKHVIASAAFVQNIVLWLETGYFDANAKMKPLLHIWSLGVEEQFYFLFPFIFWCAWRMRVNMGATIAGLGLISLALSIWTTDQSASTAFYLPHTRFWELLAGGFLAYAGVRGRSNAAGIAGLLLIGVSVFAFHSATLWPGYWAALPVLGAALVIAAGASSLPNRTLLSHPAAVYIGKISYPLYLWHWPLLAFPRITESGNVPEYMVWIAVALSFVLAALTYQLFERPLRFRFALRPAAIGAFASLLLAAGLGATILLGQGLPGRFAKDAAAITQIRTWGVKRQNQRPCEKTYAALEPRYCAETMAGQPPEILVLGDSHANTIYHGLAKHFAAEGLASLQTGSGGCLSFFDTQTFLPGEPDDCRDYENRLLRFAVESKSIRTIILAMRWPYYRSGFGVYPGDFYEGRRIVWEGLPEAFPQPTIFDASMRNTLERLHASGKQIIVLYDWPELGFDIRACANARPVRLTSDDGHPCTNPVEKVRRREAGYRGLFEQLRQEFPDISFVDPRPYLCDSEFCYGTNGENYLYRDDDHLSGFGARFVADRIIGEIMPQVRSRLSDNTG